MEAENICQNGVNGGGGEHEEVVCPLVLTTDGFFPGMINHFI